MNPLAFEIGLRYARSKRSYISVVSVVAVAGLALSVAVLLIVTSVVNGFERELRTRVLGVLPHLTLVARQPIPTDAGLASELTQTPGVAGVSPFVQGAALVVAADRTSGVLLTGVDPQTHGRVSGIGDYVSAALTDALAPRSFGVVMGRSIAGDLGVAVGDRVTVVLPDAAVTPIGVFPRQKRFTVTALLDTRSDLDARALYTNIEDAARLLRLPGRIHGYQLKSLDLFDVDQIATAALGRAGRADFYPVTWMRTHGNLYQAIALQKVTMYVLLSFLVGVAAFNLVSTLVLVVAERRSDVAILQTLGGSPGTVMVSFLTLGGAIGALGAGVGLAVGLGACVLLPEAFAWLNASVDRELMSQYFINDLPVDVRMTDVVRVLAISFVLCLVSTLYPAYRATRIAPSRILAHE